MSCTLAPARENPELRSLAARELRPQGRNENDRSASNGPRRRLELHIRCIFVDFGDILICF